MNPVGTYRVTSNYWYGGAAIRRTVNDFRWYWQANAWSWFLHHICGRNVNTFRRN